MSDRRISKGYGFGLRDNSSFQENSVSFHTSQLEDLSSIKRRSSFEHSQEDRNLFKAFSSNCKICHEPENPQEKLVRVCKCSKECWAHERCMDSHKPVCSNCGWAKSYDRESLMSKGEPSVFQSSDMESDGNNKVSTPMVSSLSESSGELRMRKAIQAATLKPHCRVCSGSRDSAENKLIFPCQCHMVEPTQSWGHKNCILEQILSTRKDSCEKCRKPFALQCEYQRVWACRDKKYCEKLTWLTFLLCLLIVICAFLISYLADPEVEFNDEETVWSYFLMTFLGLFVLGFSVAFLGVLTRFSAYKLISNVEVLCQKQEIARMTSRSHQIFEEYLSQLKQQNKLPEVKQVKSYTPVVQKPITEKSESEEVSGGVSRFIVESETNGENYMSEVMQEHSQVVDSEMVSLHLKSGDRKEDSSFIK